MDWAGWQPHYEAICREFGYDPAHDAAAANELRPFVAATNRFRDLGVDVRNRRNVAVVGCSAQLDDLRASDLANLVVIAADGATGRLKEIGVAPRLVVTDLDGEPEALRWAAAAGSRLVVHAHGDNRVAIRELVPTLGPLVYGTYQSRPEPHLDPMRNVGGFTDGDRSVLLCEELGALNVRLVAFEFGGPTSRHSHRWNPATKPAKLAWARTLVEGVHQRGRTRIEHWLA